MKKFLLFFIISLSILTSINAASKLNYEALAESGSLQDIRSALKSGDTAVRKIGPNKDTFLMLCCKNNRSAEIISECIAAGSDVMAKSKDGATPIMYYAKYGSNPKVLDNLVKSGAMTKNVRKSRVIAKDKQKRTAFDYAVGNEKSEMYTVLLNYADDPNPKNGGSSQAQTSYKAAHQEEEPVAVEESAEPSIEEEPEIIEEPEVVVTEPEPEPQPEVEEEIPLVTSTEQTVHEEEVQSIPEPKEEVAVLTPQQEEIKQYTQTFIYDYIEEEPVVEEPKKTIVIENPNKSDKNGVTLLMKAAKSGNDWDVRTLIASGANVNARDKDGWTALMYAVRYQNSLNIVNMLIENGAHIRVRNKYNATPLLMAADYSQNPEIISVLLKDRSNSEDEVFRAFIFAITGNSNSDHVREAKIKLFIDMELPVNRIWQGQTPLMYAAQYCMSTGVIKQLLDSGAKPEIQDKYGKTAFDYARDNRKLTQDEVYWSLNSAR